MKPIMTADEIVSHLQRSTLPTVLVEGADDMTVYRHIEQRVQRIKGQSFLECNGRTTLLEVYRRRDEFSGNDVMFLADSDMFVFDGGHTNYPDVVFTTGYSIENDVMCGSWSTINRLLNASEKARLNVLLNSLSEWFAFCVDEHLEGRSPQYALHINQLIEPTATKVKASYLTSIGYTTPKRQTVRSVMAKRWVRLRGKLLLNAFERVTNAHGRRPRYKEDQLMNLAVVYGRNPLIKRLIAELSD